jgi:CBS domain containing-hemolysin-like protein
MKLIDLNDLLKLEIESEDYDSIGGKIIELLDHIPKKGECASLDGVTFQVLSMERHRISRVRIIIEKHQQ